MLYSVRGCLNMDFVHKMHTKSAFVLYEKNLRKGFCDKIKSTHVMLGNSI